jgi:cAMP-dependent protein kinase regulator
VELYEFLQTTATFSELSERELAVLEKSLRVDRFPADHCLIREGEKGHTFYILMEGKVQVLRRRPSGHGIEVLETLGPGDVFGLMTLIDFQPRASSCRTLTPVTVASLPYSAFFLLYTSHQVLAEHFQYVLARQLVRDLRHVNEGLRAALSSGDFAPLYESARRVTGELPSHTPGA